MATHEDLSGSMIQLLSEMVARPSRAGEDSPEPVLSIIADWLESRGIAPEWLRDRDGQPLGLFGELKGGRPGPTYLLNATADTAPFGDLEAWHHAPDRPTVDDGWMYGRGSADSKAGIAVFCHVLTDLRDRREQLAGRLGFLFDAEEHSGSFAGIRRYMDLRRNEPPAGVMIGYPGNDRLAIGARGFLRARLTIHGVGAHSGSSSHQGVNAIDRARRLLEQLAKRELPGPDESFPLPPKLTATAIRGGGSFSLVPEICGLNLDIRLTPTFDDQAARLHLEEAVAWLDQDHTSPATEIEWLQGWPAYCLATDHPMVRALAVAAAEFFGHEVPAAVVGPSSIANYLATLGIPATAGLGVTYRNLHAPNEGVRLDTLEPTFHTYRKALMQLLT